MEDKPGPAPEPAKENKLFVWIFILACIGLGFGGTYMNWAMVYDEGKYYPKLALVAPFIGFLGLAMLIGPSKKAEEVAGDEAAARRHKLRQRLAMATMLLGLIAGGLNFAVMNGWIGGLVQQ